MATFVMPVEFTFRGTVTVEADNSDEAYGLVQSSFGMTLNGPLHASDGAIVDWEFPTHPEKQLCKLDDMDLGNYDMESPDYIQMGVTHPGSDGREWKSTYALDKDTLIHSDGDTSMVALLRIVVPRIAKYAAATSEQKQTIFDQLSDDEKKAVNNDVAGIADTHCVWIEFQGGQKGHLLVLDDYGTCKFAVGFVHLKIENGEVTTSVPVAPTAQDISLAIQTEVRRMFRTGEFPGNVLTFSQLHDYCDANCLGGMAIDVVFDSLSRAHSKGNPHESMPQGMLDVINEAQDLVDTWLKTRPANRR